MIVYIHGFNSSAQSLKARLLADRLRELGHAARFVCPDLPDRPAAAMAELETAVARSGAATTLVGSSLGGYYATWLAERYRCRAVLLNPAVRPYELLRACLGVQRNLYTGLEYDFTEQHLAELRALEVDRVTPERYLLIVATGDEVLDHRDAVQRYRGCRQIVVPGSDHGLGEFGRYVDEVIAYAGIGR
jgi:uncharacterized protein